MVWRVLECTWVASELVILLLTRTRRSTGTVRDRGSLLLLWPVIVLAITAGSWIGEVEPHTIFRGASWVRELSVGLLVLGMLLRFTAIVTLGTSFSANVAIHATQTVHRTGLFRFVRHPSYSGLLLIFAAIGVHTRSWLGLLVVFLPTCAALLYRIHVEEAALGEAFGSAYTDYCRTTKRLIPGVY